ncbi:MAG: hypothetical protein V3V14_06065 [Saprospiraceae bacterium]
MKQAYTDLNLINYIYGECDIFERLEIEDALHNDLCLKNNFDELFRAYKELPKVKFSPNRSTVDNIVKYNKDRYAMC